MFPKLYIGSVYVHLMVINDYLMNDFGTGYKRLHENFIYLTGTAKFQ